MATTLQYVRDGRVVRLLQSRSPKGIPCCVQCNKPIPLFYRRRYERIGLRPWFCRDTCAMLFARQAAEETWVAAPPAPAPLPEGVE